MDETKETGVISPTDLPILVLSSPGVPLRATLTQRTPRDTSSSREIPSTHDQPIVSKFPDVFPDELPGIPPVHAVEFNIELIPGAESISKAHYRMDPVELKELKDQLQELLERGFIRP
nr:putative reverse transcriptase domain-containing protein [Tanacetum cinerariifolium]